MKAGAPVWGSVVVGLAGMALAGTISAGGQPLSVHLGICDFSGCDLYVQALVERDEHNRSMDFLLESESYFARSRKDLDGEHAPRLNNVVFRHLPPGDYWLRVSVSGSDGELAVVRRTFVIW